MSLKTYLTFTKRERMGVITLIAILMVMTGVPYLFPQNKKEFAKADLTQALLAKDRVSDYNRRDSGSLEYHNNRYGRYPSLYRSDSGYEMQPNDRYYGRAGEQKDYDWRARNYSWKKYPAYSRQERQGNNRNGRSYWRNDYTDDRRNSNNGPARRYWQSDSAERYRNGNTWPQRGYSQNDSAKYDRRGYWRNDPAELKRSNRSSSDNFAQNVAWGGSYTHEWRPRTLDPVDINTADTSALIALPGIGSKLAARIVSFRAKLGGFTSVDQIRQVYGLRDSVFVMLTPYLKCDSAYTRRPV